MNLSNYQVEAAKTQQCPDTTGSDLIVPLLGLAGEVGELLNEYKKRLRDGDSHLKFEARVTEELGDILWYVADVATKYGLMLDDIAQHNLDKVAARWGNKQEGQWLTSKPHIYDDGFPEQEKLPRRFIVDFKQVDEGGRWVVSAFVKDQQMGQALTDNAHEPDGYRFHDVFHLACVAVLGWSPVTRRNISRKRKSNPLIDEIEDGGRAIVTEEGISALVFAYANDHAAMNNIESVDYDLLKAIKIMTAQFEVAVCTTGEWERAILMGYRVWHQVEEHEGGSVIVDLDQRSVSYSDNH